MSASHRAAVLPEKGSQLSVVNRITPDPSPNEVLIEVKAVALNPVDYYQRDFGIPPIPIYPAVLGSDVTGIVAKVGSEVKTTIKPGSRVLALASSYFKNGSPDYGAFQEYVLTIPEVVVAIPDTITFEQAAAFPLAVMTALSAWTSVGISLATRYKPEDKQAVLIWGGSSSVGTMAIQSAKTLGFTVYTTSSPKHHGYLKKLGAHATFDYKADDVVSQVVNAVKADGLELHVVHCVVDGSLNPSLEVLKQTKGKAAGKVAHSPVLPENHPTLENTEIVFNSPPMEERARNKHLYQCFHEWLASGIASGSVVSSPSVQIEKGGLEGLSLALDKLRAGVSGIKMVVPL